MLEPIQGESGVIIPDHDYLNNVQSICNNNNWLFILDEVQTGIGRTGKLFAHQHSNITPDVMTLAKGLGNGVPIGACLTKGAVNELLKPGTHGSTFGGNPLVTKVALSILDVFESDGILENVNKQSAYIHSRLSTDLKEHSAVKEIRIKGLMMAIELNVDCSTLLQKALDDQILINITGNSIRLLPPLIINKDQVDIMLEKVIKLINNAS
jgi:acetylornithine aminotransferase